MIIDKNEEKNIEDVFETIVKKEQFGIWDKDNNCFVKLCESKKYCWDKPGHAKNAFINGVQSYLYKKYKYNFDHNLKYIENNPRYEIRQFQDWFFIK